MARYQRQRARELKQDRFRDTTMGFFERLGDRLEGKGRTILYALAGLVALGVLYGVYSSWSARRTNEARRALGHAIEIAQAPVQSSPAPSATAPAISFTNERDRAQRAVEEFQKVAAKYGDPYRENARYFAAANTLTLDRAKGINDLNALTKSSDAEVAALAKFALAQAYEADAKYNEAANIYADLAKTGGAVVPVDTVNLRLATVYEKQGKRKEAADLLFNIVDASRKAKDPEGKPATPTAAARDAAQQLEKLDPARFSQLPPAPISNNDLGF